MNERDKKYLDAVDVVCIECCGNEEDCKFCKVRETVEMVEKRNNEEDK